MQVLQIGFSASPTLARCVKWSRLLLPQTHALERIPTNTAMDHEIESKAQESGEPVDNSEPEKTHGKTTEVQGDSHFHETVTAAPLDPWSRTSLQLYAILLVASLNATASGFDGVSQPRAICMVNVICMLMPMKSIFSSINAMTQYQEYFHHTELGSATGIIFMIYTIGNMVWSMIICPRDLF